MGHALIWPDERFSQFPLQLPPPNFSLAQLATATIITPPSSGLSILLATIDVFTMKRPNSAADAVHLFRDIAPHLHSLTSQASTRLATRNAIRGFALFDTVVDAITRKSTSRPIEAREEAEASEVQDTDHKVHTRIRQQDQDDRKFCKHGHGRRLQTY